MDVKIEFLPAMCFGELKRRGDSIFNQYYFNLG
jgi:hypothetical protein